jgi:quercetin dioxygenase-like cupin family protein
MPFKVLDALDIESPNGVFRGLSGPLGVGAFKINRLELAPGAEGPEHDHLKDGQEEVYAVVGGSGAVRLDGEELPVAAGNFVYCSPEVRRQMRAGDDGLVWVGVGAAGSANSPG